MTEPSKPTGPEAVRQALVEAAIELIVDRGLDVSVRQIAERAGVNHGLVHTYFGSRDGLIRAAADAVNERAGADADELGFPPPDLAQRRNGELAKALARIRLDSGQDLSSSHPVVAGWKRALATTRPDLGDDEVDTMVATASALGLGWAMFADHLADLLELSPSQRAELDKRVTSLVAELGGIPDRR